jgi:hypothetical protein
MESNQNQSNICSKCHSKIMLMNQFIHDQLCLPDKINLDIYPDLDDIKRNSSAEVHYKFCNKCNTYFREEEFRDHLICHDMERDQNAEFPSQIPRDSTLPSLKNIEPQSLSDEYINQEYDMVEDAEDIRREAEEDEAFKRKLENKKQSDKKSNTSKVTDYLFETRNRRLPPIARIILGVLQPRTLVEYAVEEVGARILNSIEDSQKPKEEDLNMLDLIPEIEVSEKFKLPEDKKDCIICMSTFEPGEKVSSLPCLHIYHSQCIKDWFKTNSTCPVCKYKITNENFK